MSAHADSQSKLVTEFVQKANEFSADIRVEHGDRLLNAKSLMGVMYIGIVPGLYVTISAIGVDETAALDALEKILGSPY